MTSSNKFKQLFKFNQGFIMRFNQGLHYEIQLGKVLQQNYIESRQQSMKQNCRLLPHLNMIYLQKRSYQMHLKKIQSIQKSMNHSKPIQQKLESFETWKTNSKVYPQAYQHHDQQTQNQSKSITNANYQMNTIQEIGTDKNKLDYLTPYDKRVEHQKKKENQRLDKQIKNMVSSISRDGLLKNSKRADEIKGRITKFKASDNSHKALLKCQHSLKILERREKQKYSSVNSRISRILSHEPSAKSIGHRSFQKYISNKESSIQQSMKQSVQQSVSHQIQQKQILTPQKSENNRYLLNKRNRKESFDQVFFQRNLHKIKGHFLKNHSFQEKTYQKLKSFQASYNNRSVTEFSKENSKHKNINSKTESCREDFEENVENQKKIYLYPKNASNQKLNCFTTQIDQVLSCKKNINKTDEKRKYPFEKPRSFHSVNNTNIL